MSQEKDNKQDETARLALTARAGDPSIYIDIPHIQAYNLGDS